MLKSEVSIYFDQAKQEFLIINHGLEPTPREISNANAISSYLIGFVRANKIDSILMSQSSKMCRFRLTHDECLVKSCEFKIVNKPTKYKRVKPPKHTFASLFTN